MSAEQWGARPRDWADLAEPSNEPLFARVLHLLGVSSGTRLLDIGCGSGYALRMAAALGADVTGIDITAELLEITRERVPSATLVEDGMDSLPFSDGQFDAAMAINAFQFADDPAVAVSEAARVVRTQGLIAATTFADPERNESTALHLALEPLRAPTQAGTAAHLPYALSRPGGLELLLGEAGLQIIHAGEVPVVWAHQDVDRAIRAVLASAGGASAIASAGEESARAALTAAVQPFVTASGRVEMHNVFRYAVGCLGAKAAR